MYRRDYVTLDEEMWCPRCGKPVEVVQYEEYEDAHDHNPFYTEIRCAECGETTLVDIDKCPVCGDEIPRGESFCKDCLQDINQYLTEYMESNNISQDILEELIAENFC